jgi:FAD/FMN-containing dehydrogenase
MLLSHQDRARDVARALAARPAGTRVTIRKATPSHSIRDSAYKNACHAVDVSGLDQILAIDAERRIARVEGQVLMRDLARAALAHGLLPAVVPEFGRFTVAGLINGEGIQSSSHRYGVFTQAVESMELLLADGSIVEASATSHPELFASVPESLGTLAIVLAATIQLVPAQPRVRVTYRAFPSRQDYLAAFRAALGTCAFHEGVIFGPRQHVLITADFAAEADGEPTYQPWQAGAPFFYQHVRAMADAAPVSGDVIDTLPYLSRSERGLWWMLECHADFPLLTETRWGRRRLERAAADAYEREGFGKGGQPPFHEMCLINQDMGVTLERLDAGLEWVQQRIGLYPIWNCAVDPKGRQPAGVETSYYVDIGLYGEPMIDGYRHTREMNALQRFVDAPSLWGVSYLTWDDIRATNPARFEKYERMRAATAADTAFLHLREKVVWMDAAQPDSAKPPLWRLKRAFGARWYLNPLIYLLLVVVGISKLIWPRPARS